MKRQKKIKRKIKVNDLFGGFKETALKRIAPVLLAVVFILAAITFFRAFLYRSDYFSLRNVEAVDVLSGKKFESPSCLSILNNYRGNNIFSVNIKVVAASLRDSYPNAKYIVVRKVLPDTLAVDVTFRRPIAILSGWHPQAVDDEGFLLPNVDMRGLKNFPTIIGAQAQSKNLKSALSLLKEMKRSKFQTDNVVSIDASDPAKLTFYLKNGLEIRIGYENLRKKLAKLKKILKDPRLVVDRISYIDLRFEEVAIGTK